MLHAAPSVSHCTRVLYVCVSVGDRAGWQGQQGGHLHHVLQLWGRSEDATHAEAER